MKTRVDVIVPCYNYGHLLEPCVRSVLTQDEVDVRVMIMDDASTDTTEQVGRFLAAMDRRVEYRRHEVNRGHIATYNEALADITGEYVVLLSADDLSTPGSLGRATRVMNAHPEVGFTYGRDITFTHTPPFSAARLSEHCGRRIMSYGEFLDRSCRLGHTPIQAPTVVVRSSLHRQIGNYLPELPHSGDTEIWLRMAAHAAVCELDADQAFRRLHANNMSLDYAPLRRLQEQKKAFDVHFRSYRLVRPEIALLEPVVNQTIGQAAFWSGVRAFDEGDLKLCEAFLQCAAATWDDLGSWEPFRRFRWKRRIGRVASRWAETAITRLRTVAPKLEPRTRAGTGAAAK